MTLDKFIDIFNDCYPFERYILKEPKSIGWVLDDLKLTEIFIPKTKIESITRNDRIWKYTKVDEYKTYAKFKIKDDEIKICLVDLSEGMIGDIMWTVLADFGDCWECLYIDHEGDELEEELRKKVSEQEKLIKNKYGTTGIIDETFYLFKR